MPLINCKIELKLKWTKDGVLSAAAAADNTNANPNNIILTVKKEKLYVSVVTLSAWDNQKLSNLLSKGFEKSVYNIKQKVRIKIQQLNIDIFWN